MSLAATCLLVTFGCSGQNRTELRTEAGDSSIDLTATPVTMPPRVDNDRFLLLASHSSTLLIQVTPSENRVQVVAGTVEDGSLPALPHGFTPESSLSTDEAFYLLGSQCNTDGSCSVSLLTSETSLVRWRQVPTEGALSGDDYTGVLGLVGDRVFVSPGVGQRPALYVLDGDGRKWTEVAQPKEANGASTSLCSTRGHVFAFTSMPLAAQYSADEIVAPDGSPRPGIYNVWSLRDDNSWSYERTDARPATSDASEPPQAEFCSGAKAFLRPIAGPADTLVVSRSDSGGVGTSRISLPSIPEGPTNLGYPPASAVPSTGQVFGNGELLTPVGVHVDKGTRTIASAETGGGFDLVVEDSTGQASLWEAK